MCQLSHRDVRMPGSFVMGTPAFHKGNLVTVLPALQPSEVSVMWQGKANTVCPPPLGSPPSPEQGAYEGWSSELTAMMTNVAAVGVSTQEAPRIDPKSSYHKEKNCCNYMRRWVAINYAHHGHPFLVCVCVSRHYTVYLKLTGSCMSVISQ